LPVTHREAATEDKRDTITY